MKTKKRILTLVMVLALSAALLIGCAAPKQAAVESHDHGHGHEPAVELVMDQVSGGVLCLKINPEIALHYDEAGKVTKLEGRNADGKKILEGVTNYAGKDTSQVLTELVELIGKAGYFVEEADGQARKIVLELDPGSQVPHEQFLEDMAAHVKSCVENKNWVGEKEYEYPEALTTEPTTPAAEPTGGSTASSTVPTGLCPVCADDDCNDGKYCDDADDKAENLREYERLMSGEVCPVCADPDCDDGQYCDDADEKAENERENAEKKEKTSSTSTKNTSTQKKTTKTKCPVCGDRDCDDGKYCDDWDDRYDDDDDDDRYDRDDDDDDDDD